MCLHFFLGKPNVDSNKKIIIYFQAPNEWCSGCISKCFSSLSAHKLSLIVHHSHDSTPS